MTGDEIMEAIFDCGLEDVEHLQSFLAVRRGRSIRLDVYDGGPGPHRWRIEVIDNLDGTPARGTPARTLELALSAVHWADLDRPPTI